jgi:uncharacterized protein (DUF2252 family)
VRPAATTVRSFVAHPSRAELYRHGKKLREKSPRQSHATWQAPANRPDPLSLLEESSKGRLPELIPVRYGRMLQSPFTFYRGAALNMAADLARTPVTGLQVQACGDAHLLNFGMFATPERREIFDINDDETLPAPWEWDVKRLAASFVLACRNNGFTDDFARDTVLACAGSYRRRMAEYSEMTVLDVWYASLEVEDMIQTIKDPRARKRLEKRLTAARHRSVLEHEFPKLVEVLGQLPVIKDNPPLIYHWHEESQEKFFADIQAALVAYRETLEDDRRFLLDRYEVEDVAIKVVGVGSVGTWCGIALLLAGEEDPLFLQIKEARASVLEPYAGESAFPNHGQRVVDGCRLMQSASDLFLGWTVGPRGRHFYIRQLKDMKIKMLVEAFSRSAMMQYAGLCGWALARAHARSGEPAAISGYLGKSDKFDQAIADFSIAYADQSALDHRLLLKAVREGRLKVVREGEGLGDQAAQAQKPRTVQKQNDH